MDPAVFAGVSFAIAIGAGCVGAVLGLGGGIIVIPALLACGVEMRFAVGAAAVSVVATSSGAASQYLKKGLSSLRVAMFLEVGTVAGAITGALCAGLVDERALYLLLGSVLVVSAVAILRKKKKTSTPPPQKEPGPWHLAGVVDEGDGPRPWVARRPPLALAVMYVAGVVSGLLGIGSGALKVLAMDLAMGLPLKVSSATSNLMMGVTAATTAAVCLARGDIDPVVVGPVALGIVVGARAGAALLPRLPARAVRAAFVIVVVVIAAQMLYRGLA